MFKCKQEIVICFAYAIVQKHNIQLVIYIYSRISLSQICIKDCQITAYLNLKHYSTLKHTFIIAQGMYVVHVMICLLHTR